MPRTEREQWPREKLRVRIAMSHPKRRGEPIIKISTSGRQSDLRATGRPLGSHQRSSEYRRPDSPLLNRGRPRTAARLVEPWISADPASRGQSGSGARAMVQLHPQRLGLHLQLNGARELHSERAEQTRSPSDALWTSGAGPSRRRREPSSSTARRGPATVQRVRCRASSRICANALSSSSLGARGGRWVDSATARANDVRAATRQRSKTRGEWSPRRTQGAATRSSFGGVEAGAPWASQSARERDLDAARRHTPTRDRGRRARCRSWVPARACA